MAGAKDVASFGVRFLQDEAAFRRTVTHPVLLWESPPATREEPLLFATRPGEQATRPTPGRAVFFNVVKSAKNAFADEVTLGRTGNNDITIEDNTVSRFHAYFAPDEKSGVWSLVDAKSTAGTWLSGKKLGAKVPQAIEDTTRLRVGEVELQFLEPKSFWAYLRKLLRAK